MNKVFTIGVIVAVLLVALGIAGVAYAQDQTPTVPENTYGAGMMGGQGRHGGMMGGFRAAGSTQASADGLLHDYMFSAIASVFGVTPEELQAAHDAGQTMWDLAQEQGLTQEQFAAKMLEARTQALGQAVADGVITQEQADWMLSRMSQMGQGTGGGPCMGGDFAGRGGRSGGRWNMQPVQPVTPDA